MTIQLPSLIIMNHFTKIGERQKRGSLIFPKCPNSNTLGGQSQIEKLTSYMLDYDMTVEQFRLKYPGGTYASIFEHNGTFIMPPDTPTIRKMCQAEGQDIRSTTI